ncbi:Rho GTPase-activating protein 6, partial [Geodia barretti]
LSPLPLSSLSLSLPSPPLSLSSFFPSPSPPLFPSRQQIKQKFDRGEDVDLTDANPHDIAALLKEFFRSLPEPLMTRELFGPILGTRKLSSSAQRRDALRLFCLLLPHANRDTLQALLQFLSRVALHSDGIILIDGTQETGNRMTEQNLGLIMGPNILHKEVSKWLHCMITLHLVRGGGRWRLEEERKKERRVE